MTPGIPWSVLGIQPDARATAEAEARRAGLPVGEWLNDMIRRTADTASYEPPAFPSGHLSDLRARGAAPASTLRRDYDRITTELAALNLRDADTGLARASEAPPRAWPGNPERGADQAGDPMETVERTIHAIIQHLESSDRRNADALRELQSEMRNIAARADARPAGEDGGDPRHAIVRMEQRLDALASKIEANRPARSDPESEAVEDRLAKLAARIERLTGREGASPPPQPAPPADEQPISPDPAAAEAAGGDDANPYVTAFMRRRARRQDARSAAEQVGQDANLEATEQSAPRPERTSERLAELADSLQSSLSDPTPSREVADLHRLVRELSAKVDALAAREPPPPPVDLELPQHVAELTRRLDAAEVRFSGLDTIEPMLAEIAARIDAAEARFSGAQSMEPTLVELTARIDAAEESLHNLATAREDTSRSFERQFESLFEQLEASRHAMIDAARLAAAEAAGEAVGDAAQKAAQQAIRQAQDAAVAAAREAARSYMEMATAAAPAPRSADEARVVEMLQQSLQQLRGDLDASDRKTESAFEAVQETLQGIAERLMGVEQKRREEAIPRSPAPSTEYVEPPAAATGAGRGEMPAVERPPLPEALAGLRLPPLGKPAFEASDARQPDAVRAEAEDAAEATPETEKVNDTPEELNRPREPGSGPPPSIIPDLGMQLRPAGERSVTSAGVDRPIEKSKAAPGAEAAADVAHSLSGARTTNELLAAARRAAEAAAAQGGRADRNNRVSLKDRLRIPLSRQGRSTAETGKEAKNGRTAAAKRSNVAVKQASRAGARKSIVLAVAAVILFAGSVEIYNMLKKRSADMLPQPATSQEESMGSAEPAAEAHKTALPDAPAPAEVQPLAADTTGGAWQQFEAPQQAASDETPTGTLAPSGEALTPNKLDVASVRAETPSADAFSAAMIQPVGGNLLPPAVAADTGHMPDLPETVGTPALRQAAIGGDPIAQFEVASRLAEGRGVTADAKTAAAWYRLAAASGLAPAQYRLGSLYEKGVGVVQDRDAARVWYERAAAKGNRKAMHNLAVLYADGVNGQPNFEAAARWFRAAADLGLPDSQYNLGILYARGLGVPQNLSESYKWFSILANRGDKDAAIRRDAVADKLDPQTLAATKLAAQTWKAKRLDPEANAVRLPNEGWATQLDQASSAQPGADIIRNAQKLLARLGYEPGPVDGQWGPKTRGAIESFERDAGLQPTGALTPDLLRKLQQQASS